MCSLTPNGCFQLLWKVLINVMVYFSQVKAFMIITVIIKFILICTGLNNLDSFNNTIQHLKRTYLTKKNIYLIQPIVLLQVLNQIEIISIIVVRSYFKNVLLTHYKKNTFCPFYLNGVICAGICLKFRIEFFLSSLQTIRKPF